MVTLAATQGNPAILLREFLFQYKIDLFEAVF